MNCVSEIQSLLFNTIVIQCKASVFESFLTIFLGVNVYILGQEKNTHVQYIYIYIHIYICICISVCTYIYIYTYMGLSAKPASKKSDWDRGYVEGGMLRRVFRDMFRGYVSGIVSGTFRRKNVFLQHGTFCLGGGGGYVSGMFRGYVSGYDSGVCFGVCFMGVPTCLLTQA